MRSKQINSWFVAVGLFAGVALSGSATAATELCLSIDGSGSISTGDFDLQLEGYATNIENPAVLPQDGSIILSVVQFSTGTQVEVSPTTIDSQSTADSVASTVRNISQLNGSTAIGDSILTCTNQFGFAAGDEQVIDISTDGSSNTGADPVVAADDALAAGVDVINAIAVGGGADIATLEATVRPQPASMLPDPGFVLEVMDFSDFEPAIEAKIMAETGGGGGGSTAIPALNRIGLIILGLILLAGGGLILRRRQTL